MLYDALVREFGWRSCWNDSWNSSDPVVVTVGNINLPLFVHLNPAGMIHLRGRSRPTVAGKTGTPGAGYRRYDSRRIHLADALISEVRDVKIPLLIHGYLDRVVQFRRDSRPAIAAESFNSIAGDRRNDARGTHLSYALIPRIGDVEIS